VKWVFWIFLGLYAFATFIFLTGTFGWFGQAKDPLSGVFLIPLGWPWNILADRILGDRIDVVGPAVGLLSPAINAAILFWLWKR
jgi:drug/metabolite transporter superfamily protein YnfA